MKVGCVGLAVVGLFLGGCGDSTPVVDNGRAGLSDLGEALKTVAADGQKPPAKIADLDKIEPMTPVGGPAIRSGELTYIWGSAYVAGGTKVIAYEKKAEAEGGWVLLEDGTVKRMTADELRIAPKATPGKK
jgi:hypothetical protein